jgi:D-aminopeptidase
MSSIEPTPQRARDLGVPLDGSPGTNNAITDVAGIEVGYETLIRGEGKLRVGEGPVRTGVTAVLPRGKAGVGKACAAGWFSLNGNGELTGTTWIEEAGVLNMPVLITNTHSVGSVHQGAINWTARNHPQVAHQWMLPVVGETWDGYLNDINGSHVTPQHAIAALDAARSGAVAEGVVGGGTGMTCYGFKGGTGTASRLVEFGAHVHTVGVLLQANFGNRQELTVAGVPAGRQLDTPNPESDSNWFAPAGSGSVIVIVATDAPMLPGQCKALARRVSLGLARTGTTGSHFSGDIFLAFSTAEADGLMSSFSRSEQAETYNTVRCVPWGQMDRFYKAVVEATEEAVLNALVAAQTTVGVEGRVSPGLPNDQLAELMKKNFGTTL